VLVVAATLASAASPASTSVTSNTPPLEGSIASALAKAKAAREPLFIDFSALWCHSCWWMKTYVMNGPEWEALGKRVLYVESDADSVDGQAWMQKLNVGGLPTYVLLDGDGREIGRLAGESNRQEFYPKVERLMAGADSLGIVKAKAARGAPADVAQVLNTYSARGDFRGALAWYATLSAKVRAQVEKDASILLNLEMLRMRRDRDAYYAAAANAAVAPKASAVAKGCVEHGQRALPLGPDYDDRIDILNSMSNCSENLSPAQRKALLAGPIAEAVAQLDAQKLSQRPLTPGTREAVAFLAMMSKSIGDEAGAKELFARGIAAYRQQMDDGKGGLDVTKDRSAADDLFALYRYSEQNEETTRMAQLLATAFNGDCNYTLSYGKILLKDNKPAEALPVLEKAADMATGRYVLWVATARAKALIALDRRAEAERVVADASQAAGAWFPKEQKALKDVLAVKGDSKSKAL
jgi:predicted Zn-dependent protease